MLGLLGANEGTLRRLFRVEALACIPTAKPWLLSSYSVHDNSFQFKTTGFLLSRRSVLFSSVKLCSDSSLLYYKGAAHTYSLTTHQFNVVDWNCTVAPKDKTQDFFIVISQHSYTLKWNSSSVFDSSYKLAAVLTLTYKSLIMGRNWSKHNENMHTFHWATVMHKKQTRLIS